MLIDWFTVGAQLLNFAILAWLMKRFLYQPILDAIDAREKRIATELAAAGRKQREAQDERDELQQKNADFDQQRDGLLQQARADAGAERNKLLDAARSAADDLTRKRQAALAGAAKALGQSLRQRAQSEVFSIARQTLGDLAGASLEASACARFIAQMKLLEGQPKDDLKAALASADDTVVVRSAFDLPAAQQRAIEAALEEVFKLQPALTFETAPELVAGIELVAQGQKFAWHLAAQLDGLEHEVARLLKAPGAA